MENNVNEVNSDEENNNMIILEESNIPTEKGNLFLPIQVENYLNVIIFFYVLFINN